MNVSARAGIGVAALLISTLGVGAPASVGAAPASTSDAAAARAAATPTLVFAINKHGTIKLDNGPSTFRPGRIKFKVSSKNPNASLGFVRFDKGYTFKDFRTDVKATNHGDMKALKRAISHSMFLGGVSSPAKGKPTVGTVVLPKEGTYTVYNFGGGLPDSPVELTAAGKARKDHAPDVTGKISALSGIQFGGQSSIPHHGVLQFSNKASDSPHFLELLQVQPGTTEQEILDYFQSGSEEPPPFYIADGLATEVVGPHQSMTLKYDLPAGTYAELCFFPDPKMDGMPHAFMGMIRIITLH
jgi:hypothetical protein